MNTAPNNDVPNAPPRDRKKIIAAVPVPTGRGHGVLTASTMICMVMPMPAPRTTT